MSNIILYLFYFFTFYAFLPGIISRLFGFRVFKRGLSDTEISLTFDDGPDPEHTPRLLDLLKKHDVKATFFVVGKHAEAQPDIVERMHREGHSIGIHNYSHRSNWVMRPKSVARHVRMTSEAIERMTGEKPKFYRPPWGIMNLFDFASRSRMQVVLWSAMPGDWRVSTGAKKIENRMMKSLKGGEVYLLHDCGNTFGADREAPRNTIEALERFIPAALERGFSFVRVDDLMQSTAKAKSKAKREAGPIRKTIVGAWLLWERAFHALFRLESAIPGDSKSFLFYRVTAYHGQTVPLPGGETLRSGDKIVELHMNNELLYEFGRKARSTLQLAIQLIRAMERTMPQLAASVLQRSDAPSIKAVVGTSMVNRGVEQFGFTVVELPKGLFASATRLYLKCLLSVIHPQGKDRLGERSEMLIPKMIALSSTELIRRYGEAVSEVAAGEVEATNGHMA
ncbi:polysaccharide deacetylase family protein [Paenibacillus antri]|uniref:Polysaccharide deacetylase family protein n=1 Tax=Paenibacillus antri TaxID=2582848 RepID=A0A5R9GKQ9_9BACL|nr:polysaccharide deacetylase family protein [Paenibacillus antri]TLS53603.1 polysaccharide deacetylase family protein [Paenibacillus antri]